MFAMVDLSGSIPMHVEWPTRLPINTPVIIGDGQYYSGKASDVAGVFETVLMREPLLPDPEHVGAIASENASIAKDVTPKTKSAGKAK